MNRFLEVQDRTYGKQMINLDNVEILSKKSYEVVMTGGKRFKIIKDSFDKLCSALKEYKEPSESILCNLQHDHTWIKQAVCNLTAMTKKDNVGYKPALLVGCNDKELDVMFSECYDKVRKMQERIKELEKQVEIKTEPKKG